MFRGKAAVRSRQSRLAQTTGAEAPAAQATTTLAVNGSSNAATFTNAAAPGMPPPLVPLPPAGAPRGDDGTGTVPKAPRWSQAAEEEEADAVVGSSTTQQSCKPVNQGDALAPGTSIPDFLELSAPANLPDSMRPAWLPEDAWGRLRDLGKLWPYNKILPLMFATSKDVEASRLWYNQLADKGFDHAGSPHHRVADLTPFQRLLLVRCMQTSAFLSAAVSAVRFYLGPACIQTESVDLDTAFPMTHCGTPIVLISSSDQPLPQLMLFAEMRMVRLIHMAIGRGQGFLADKVIRASLSQPVWVVLENTHLAGEWMPALCSLVQALPAMKPHLDFRLWLTMVPSQDFPPVILQTSLKLVMDPPAGLKANLASVIASLPSEVATAGHRAAAKVEGPALKSFGPSGHRMQPDREVLNPREAAVMGPAWRQLVLRLCLFHALLLERQHYGTLGWRRSYEFSAADFLSTVKQVVLVHREMSSSQAIHSVEAELEAVNRALPGLLYVDGQCLYGGKVTQDWDRRLLVVLLQAQLTPRSAGEGGEAQAVPPGSAVPTVESLLPPKVASGVMELQQVAKELRLVKISASDPSLVGLTGGAAAVRRAQQTRYALNMLQRVQLMQGATDSEAEAAKPLQVALGVAQDVSRQLPFTVLPTVLSAWAAIVQVHKPGTPRTQTPGPSTEMGLLPSVSSGAAAKLQSRSRPVNRARQLKMTEVMSCAAQDRWTAMGVYEQQMMVQVFENEVACCQALLTAVHSSIKLVTSAIKGFEPVTGEFQELVRQLSSNEVPRSWAMAGPGGTPVDLVCETLTAWVSDLLSRLDWLYAWAVEGPPVVLPLGMLSRPKAYLTALQQIHAERLDCAVSKLQFEVHVLEEEERDVVQAAMQCTAAELDALKVHSSQGGVISVLRAIRAGCLISGAALQGAVWDRKLACLNEIGPDRIYCPMPLLWLIPVPERQTKQLLLDEVRRLTWPSGGASLSRMSSVGLAHSWSNSGFLSSRPSADGPASKPGTANAATRDTAANNKAVLSQAATVLATKGSGASESTALAGIAGFNPQSIGSDQYLPTAQSAQPIRMPGSIGTLPAGRVMVSSMRHLLQCDDRHEVPAVERPPAVQGGVGEECYVCPCYMHTQNFGSGIGNDVDDCLFDLLLPPGRFSPSHWVARHVVMLITSDPSQLAGLQPSAADPPHGRDEPEE
ncbi:dynein heavy chain and region D6 of dynein motor-domain-containing protein [Haematococcus lacustris]